MIDARPKSITTEGSAMAEQVWQKSSRSATGISCLEVAHACGGIRVRDSKDTAKPHLFFTAATWVRFQRSVTAGPL
ncbi:DUF397 domain-containing protein [Streptomyces phaeochromogenes]|uniref:DUF397 domain-containing protein n=1 Tax=Streptomyces phaeochromogenes TaxID=1923 RepID=UPI0033EB85FD